jgi:arachidonate 5-lipoxygenase
MSALWVIQFCVLTLATALFIVRPSTLLFVLEECTVVSECVSPAPAAASAAEGPRARAVPELVPSEELCGDKPRGLACLVGKSTTWERCRPGRNERSSCTLVEHDHEVEQALAVVRLISPFFFAFALFSGYAAMREDERMRRNVSFVFAWIHVFLALFLATDSFTDLPEDSASFLASHALEAFLAAFGVFSVYTAIRAKGWAQRALSLLIGGAYGALLLMLLRIPQVIFERSSELNLVFLRIPEKIPELTWETAKHVALGLLAADLLLTGIARFRARLFALFIVIPYTILLARKTWQPLADEPDIITGCIGAVAFCAFFHALYAIWPMEPAARKLAGSANTLPSRLWVVWLLQGLAFFGLAYFLSRPGLQFFLNEPSRFYNAYEGLLQNLDDLLPPFMGAIGLFSFVGTSTQREWAWKAHCIIFAVFYLSVSLAVLFVWNDDIFHARMLLLGAISLVLMAVHVRFYMTHRVWFSEEVGEGPNGWTFIDLLMGPLFLIRTLLSKRRATHARGVAAQGTLRVALEPDGHRLDHDFFRLGAELNVQVRFSNERSADDAGVDARGAALRLSAPDRSPFDLLLSTGSFCAAENIAEYGLIATATGLGKGGRRWLAKNRKFLEGGIAALRRAPESYTKLWYYSQSVRFWVTTDNKRFLVRYRLIPKADAQPEPAEVVTPVTRADYIDRRRLPEERRPTDYLRGDLKMLLQGGRTVTLALQAQFHEIRPGDDLNWYNPGTDWNEASHPWMLVANVVLTDTLPDEETERLCFSPDNAPASLATPVAQGFFDHRSIADSQRRVMRRVQSLRHWMISTFGVPSSTSTTRGVE